MDFDIASVRSDDPLLPAPPIPARKMELDVHRRRKRDRFIPPTPLAWFDRVCRLPGKALAVGLILRRLANVHKSDTVTLTNATLQQHGLSRWEKYAALESLKSAGLISIQPRGPRKSPSITLLDPPAPDNQHTQSGDGRGGGEPR
jgi:hypothetical protein